MSYIGCDPVKLRFYTTVSRQVAMLYHRNRQKETNAENKNKMYTNAILMLGLLRTWLARGESWVQYADEMSSTQSKSAVDRQLGVRLGFSQVMCM